MLWFKNVIFYRFEPDNTFNEATLNEALAKQQYTPCGKHELKRSGWHSPAAALSDELVLTSNGFSLISLMTEERILPASVVNDSVQEKVDQIENSESRKVSRKERTQLKEEIIFELLPQAFTRRKPLQALIMPRDGWILVNASSASKAEELLSALRDSLGSLRVRLAETQQTPAVVMSAWLTETANTPSGVVLGEECELNDANSEEKGSIKVKGQFLQSPEIKAHIEGGMQVTRLAIEWDEQIELVLHDDLSLHRLKLTDQYAEQLDDQSPEEEFAALDADIAQLGLEYSRLLPKLLSFFGGEPQR